MLQKILSMCISLDTPILDPLCVLRIKRKQEKRHSLSYIPIEAKEKDTDKYLFLLLDLSIPAYTQMEKAEVFNGVKTQMHKQGIGYILQMVAAACTTFCWKQEYNRIVRHIQEIAGDE